MKKHSSNASRTLVFALMCMLSFTGFHAFAQDTVYIDPSYAGSTQNGKIETPYKSWKKITSFKDNTAYLQKRGTIDTITAYTLTKKKGLTIGAYGEGSNYATVQTKSTGITFKIQLCSNFLFDGIHLIGSGSYASSAGIVIVDIIDGSWSDVAFDAYNIKVSNSCIENYKQGTVIQKLQGNHLDTISFENVKIHKIYTDGMFIQGYQAKAVFNSIDINQCYIDSVNMCYNLTGGDQTTASGDGIQISSAVNNWRIRNTVIDRRNSSLKFCIIHGDENVAGNIYGGTVENCTLYAPDILRNSEANSGSACYFSLLDTVNFRNNKVIGNSKAIGILLRYHTALNCAYNVFTGFTGGSSRPVFDIYSNYSSVKNRIYNNTFYNNGYVYYRTGGSDLAEIKNNIFSKNSNTYPSTSGVTKDYNLYYNSTYSGTETHSLNSDPMFVDPGNKDFHLQTGSPCINAGTDLGYTSDIDGTVLSGNPDIGAYEYSSGSELEEINNTASVFFFPNPASTYLNIKLEKPSVINIIDLTGRIVQKESLSAGQQEIQLNTSPGWYLIKAVDEQGKTSIGRFVVKI